MYKYEEELNFITETIISGYKQYDGKDVGKREDKAAFDLVTSVDYGVENYIISAIKNKYPEDFILSEELNNLTEVRKRTWTIDPIDGTVNMAYSIPLFGIQCSLMVNGEPVVGVIYLPTLNELYTAVKEHGAFLNNKKILVSHRDIKHCVVSFGDFPHSRLDDSELEHKIMSNLSKAVSKVRMFGAASIDFAFVASGKTSGTIIFTKNKWDIVPGIIICKEAGALIKSLNGNYSFDDNVVVAVADETVYNAIIEAKQ